MATFHKLRPRCIASIFPTPHTPHPIPCLVFSLVVTPSGALLPTPYSLLPTPYSLLPINLYLRN
ncbi:MAG: hypothetical protein F6K26_28540 [Moorea sp. SIO2I5]|nr:hypothetical protein [Moorena sp. SIO2I5]